MNHRENVTKEENEIRKALQAIRNSITRGDGIQRGKKCWRKKAEGDPANNLV